MNKMRIVMIAAVLIIVLIPVAVSAAGTFYCSTLRTTGGTGTYSNPWACSTSDQFNNIVYDVICYQYGGGHLYRIYTDSYVYYRIEWVNQQCDITFQNEYPGYPPDTGVDIPMPLVLSGAVAVGAIMLAVGLLLRRKSREATQ